MFSLPCCRTDCVSEPESSTVDEGEAQIQIGRMIPLLQVFVIFCVCVFLRYLLFICAPSPNQEWEREHKTDEGSKVIEVHS